MCVPVHGEVKMAERKKDRGSLGVIEAKGRLDDAKGAQSVLQRLRVRRGGG